VVDRLADSDSPIDLLVNNAGFGMHASLLDIDVSEFDRGFEVMCRAVFVLSGAAARGESTIRWVPRRAVTCAPAGATASSTSGSTAADRRAPANDAAVMVTPIATTRDRSIRPR